MREKLSVSAAFLRLFQTGLLLQFITGLLKLPRRLRRYILFAGDSIIFLIAACIALNLRFEDSPLIDQFWYYQASLALTVPIKFCIFYLLGMYRPLLRHTGAEILWLALKAVILSEAGLVAFSTLLHVQVLPRSVQIISALITWIGVVGIRFSIRRFLVLIDTAPQATHAAAVRSRQRHKSLPYSTSQRIIIYGAGSAGFQLSQALLRETEYQVIAFVDDNPEIHGRSLDRAHIYSPTLLRTLIAQYQITMVLLAVPSASPQDKRRILQSLKGLPVKVKTVPSVREIVAGHVPIGKIRNVDISDLLGRAEVLPDPSLLRVNITDKSVLVTGAGGSIGSELCRQIAQQNPRLLVLYELNEFALYSIETELAETYPNVPRFAYLGSVTDGDRLSEVLEKHQVETVYHAAAYKHVPLVESNAAQGIINNAYGTMVTAQTAEKCRVETFVLISTDKAVRPTNVMGATKRIAELVLQALAARAKTRTRFVMVRFGNVLNSNGSVVPRFRQQIAAGQPITLTHPEMTRYFMSIPEASRLVIQAGAMAQGGEVFLLDMGEPVRIYDLAVQMIELSGLVPGADIDIEITGLRPGEKLYEELLISGNSMATSHPKIFAAREAMIPWEQLEPLLDQLFLAAYQKNATKLRSLLKTLVPEYQPSSPKSMDSVLNPQRRTS
ncbi:nucleoside-diphosphate sugar epimerase/dehydratase [Leptolyngbya boryana CZ1]|uniref:Nucleoside-diphosphate sugar epimerase/dehydratase n=1 Tax=Leptolyngbya boryana CZ1 TaxID=3060204 RepID=A0AA96WVB5_LEPBY|nr:nucleoside-diphosphate sugar epimerase/dehydratase [Leptolyngbya boryana]WNZ44854.1 nucleoside-diphosphate sugar epimerase/dehydratase [Leptolyngbya boryana CZ1]